MSLMIWDNESTKCQNVIMLIINMNVVSIPRTSTSKCSKHICTFAVIRLTVRGCLCGLESCKRRGRPLKWGRWSPESGHWYARGPGGSGSPKHTAEWVGREKNVAHEPRLSNSTPLQAERMNTLVQAELMTDLWKSPLTKTWKMTKKNITNVSLFSFLCPPKSTYKQHPSQSSNWSVLPCIHTQMCRYCSPARPVEASPSQSSGCSAPRSSAPPQNELQQDLLEVKEMQCAF